MMSIVSTGALLGSLAIDRDYMGGWLKTGPQ